MALTISQIMAASYQTVLNEKRSPTNQWAENGMLREMERQGMINRISFGTSLDVSLDYQANQGATFLDSELQELSLAKTDILTAASFTIAELAVPIVWTNRDEVQNPTVNQKVDLAKARMENGIKSHDDKIERALFATSTSGFLGLLTHVPTSGQGIDGGIDSATYTWHRNQQVTYVDETDIEAAFTSLWNACSKASGSDLTPTLMVSDGNTQALFEGTQQALQRYVDEQELKAGFKIIGFKTGRYVFSQYASTSVFFLNPKSFSMKVSKEYFRDMSETIPLINQPGYTRRLYSSLQTVTDNKSRLGVAHL